MDILERSGRSDRHEILGNRMTAYGTGPGGGSVNYWDGLWDNDPSEQPYQMRAVYEGSDGALTFRDEKDMPVAAQRYYHRWQPDVVRSNYLAHDRIVVKEQKGIWNDVFISLFQISQPAMKPRSIVLCREGILPENTRARILPGGVLHLLSLDGKLKGIHRLIALGPGRTEARVTKRDFSLKRLIRVKANTEKRCVPACAYFIVAMGTDLKDTRRRLRDALRDPAVALWNREKEWKNYFEQNVPEFACSDPMMEKFYYHSFYVAKGNLFNFVEGSFSEPYTCPSKMRLLPQWFWDMGFHAIHEKWTHGMPFPKSCIRNCLNAQHENGHLIVIHCKKGDGDFLEHLGYHECIQPFIVPMSIWDIYLKDGDKSFLKECLPRLAAFDEWMRRERDPENELLVNLVIPGESGWDNSKRYIPEGMALTPDTCGMKALPVQPVDFNAYVYIGRWLIRRMAEEVRDTALARKYDAIVAGTAEAISSMFDRRIGMYADKFIGERRLSKVKSAGGLIPLLAGLATRAQSDSVVNHLLNPKEFWSRYPVPSLSMDDPDFICDDSYQSYWNGRGWVNVNWLILEGLMRTGQLEAARRLLERTLELGVCLGEPHMTENFHPHEPYCYDVNQNTICYGWSGVISDVIIRRALGVQPNVPRGEVILNPMLPENWDRASIGRLKLGKHSVSVSVERAGKNAYDVLVEHSGPESLTFRAGPAKTLTLGNRSCNFRMRTWKAPHWLDL